MKLASFVADGHATYGLVAGAEGLIDLGARVGAQHRNLRRLVASGELESAVKRFGGAAQDYRFADVRFLPPIPRPYCILSSGGNFPGHIKEMVDAGMSKGPPAFPGFHIKTSSSLVGHMNPLVKPKASNEFDFENEFAIIIGAPCHHVSPQDALKYVLGYSGFNDGSIRDYQLTHSVSAGKNFDRSSSFGPWIATVDEVGDTAPLFITTRLNGEVVQHEQIGTLQFPIEQLISYFSSIVYLQPGDVVTTGTCGGVGYFRKPQLFMKAGDKLEIEVDRVGVMKHDIIDEALAGQ
jgi:2-keto-4-pentenoate hydratase/2-oxohepta-3-ene-1,7-dioic acid hydratase in catechol pathway